MGSQLGKATVTWAKEQQRHVQKHAATEEKRRLVAQAKKNLVIPNAAKIEVCHRSHSHPPPPKMSASCRHCFQLSRP